MEKLTSVLTDEEKSRFMENAVFPSELDKLGQKETENYIAVVHIDGNNMGKKFADLTTLSAYKNKSGVRIVFRIVCRKLQPLLQRL